MSSRSTRSDRRAARTEAAAWFARLRSEDRTAEDERRFLAWLAESQTNRDAFELTDSVFDMAGAADRSMLRTPRVCRLGWREVLHTGLGFAAASLAGIASYLRSESTYATEIAEQRNLEDGTVVSLDTDTKIHVYMNQSKRRVKLRRGRAYFNVTEDPTRPFEVIAGTKHFTATGAHFDVSRNGGLVSVLGEKGALTIAPVDEMPGMQLRCVVEPGQRLVFAATHMVCAEYPVMSNAIAWRHGRLAFFEEPLAEAVAAMNRYTRRPVVILDREIGQMTISGTYALGDTEAFATSIAAQLPVAIERGRERVTLRAKSGAQKNSG